MKLKLVSLNIWQGHALDAVCEFLAREKPDIITLQEVYNGTGPALSLQYRSLEELIKRLGLPYNDYEPALIDNRKEGKIPEGNATLSRFPIVAREAIFFNEPFRDDYIDDITQNPSMPHILLHSVLETPEGEVNIYNLHGTWDLNGENFSEKRRQMSEAIIAATSGKSCVIVAGDTNAKPINQAMRNVEKHLISVFGDELATTFNMSRKDNPGYATAAVDMVFVSHDVQVVSKECPGIDVSDHLPLVVTLEVSKTHQTETAEALQPASAL